MSLWTRIANALRGNRLNREIDEEFESHLEEAVAHGRDAAEARHEALHVLAARGERVQHLRRVLEERRQRLLRELREATGPAQTADEVCTLASAVLASDSADLPFCLIYMTESLPSGAMMGRSFFISSPNNGDCNSDWRACIQLTLPFSVLISPLCAM